MRSLIILFIAVLNMQIFPLGAAEKNDQKTTPKALMLSLSDKPESKIFQFFFPKGFQLDTSIQEKDGTMYTRPSPLNENWTERVFIFQREDKSTVEGFLRKIKAQILSLVGTDLIFLSDNIEENKGVKIGKRLFMGPEHVMDEKSTPIKRKGVDLASVTKVIQEKGSQEKVVIAYMLTFPSNDKSKSQPEEILGKIEKTLDEHMVISEKALPPKNWYAAHSSYLIQSPDIFIPTVSVDVNLSLLNERKKMHITLPDNCRQRPADESQPGMAFDKIEADGTSDCSIFVRTGESKETLEQITRGYFKSATERLKDICSYKSLEFITKDGYPFGEIVVVSSEITSENKTKNSISVVHTFKGEDDILGFVFYSRDYFPEENREDRGAIISSLKSALDYRVVLSDPQILEKNTESK